MKQIKYSKNRIILIIKLKIQIMLQLMLKVGEKKILKDYNLFI
jgi:hypothetical protein